MTIQGPCESHIPIIVPSQGLITATQPLMTLTRQHKCDMAFTGSGGALLRQYGHGLSVLIRAHKGPYKGLIRALKALGPYKALKDLIRH